MLYVYKSKAGETYKTSYREMRYETDKDWTLAEQVPDAVDRADVDPKTLPAVPKDDDAHGHEVKPDGKVAVKPVDSEFTNTGDSSGLGLYDKVYGKDKTPTAVQDAELPKDAVLAQENAVGLNVK